MFSFFFKSRPKLPRPTIEEIRHRIRVLFIDDNEFPTIDVLRMNGIHATRIPDLDQLDDARVKESHVICVDISGVGINMKFRKEGLGLLSALHKKHPEKKYIVYSATPRRNIFQDELDCADRRIAKDSEPTAFIEAVEELAHECFNWDACVTRIYQQFKVELGGIEFKRFESALINSIKGEKPNGASISRTVGVSLTRAAEIATVVASVLSAMK